MRVGLRSDRGIKKHVPSEEARFWTHVNKTDSCWLWTSAACHGYGYFTRNNQNGHVRAHRYSYELVHGKIPEGLVIHHKCGNKLCVNPDHLEAVTLADHSDDITAIQKKQTHCKNGHEFTAKNTIICDGKRRRCKICRDLYNRRYRKHYLR